MPSRPVHSAFTVLAVLAAAGIAGPATAHGADREDVRISIEVQDPRTGESRVSIHAPLGALEAMMEIAEKEIQAEFSHTRQHGLDLRKLYLALRDEDLTDFLELSSGDEQVKIWKDTEAFHLQVREAGERDPKVRIYLPLLVMDALFTGEQESDLDLGAAVEALRDLAPITLVEVDEEDATVRVWLE